MTTKKYGEYAMTENMKKLLEFVSANKELAVKIGGKAGEGEKTCACVMGGGEYSDSSVRCVCIIGGDGNR